MRYRDENGKGFSQTYLRTINNQLSAIMNHAVKYYGLSRNPSSVDKKMGQSKAVEMKFWTQEEFERFIPAVSDKPVSYRGFMILFWTGLRIGELLALTPADIDLEKRRLTVNKTYQRIEGEDLISEPKTPKSWRTISLPAFLCDYIADYEKRLVGLKNDDRLFPYTKYFFEHEMQRGVKESGVKKIRIHDLRHSHASLLVSMGFSIKEIQQRLGHEKVETTLNTYAHLYPDTQDELADRLDVRFKGKENDG
jgi:integrase